MKKYLLLPLILIFTSCISTNEKPTKKYSEKYYQEKFCKELNGKIEYRLFDKTRVDCLTNEYAIEVDFAKKWAEGIGQSLYYSKITKREPAVALIINIDSEERYLRRLKTVAKDHNITIFLIQKEN
jgi:predicted amino acid racemase